MNKNKVSIILPTCNRYEVCKENVENILKQEYADFEIIICDDSNLEYYTANYEEFSKFISSNKKKVRYVYCALFDRKGKKDYGLARARNFGIIESTGEFLVFLDDRITPDKPNVIELFVNAIKGSEKTWFFGNKGADKSSFVENFSAIRKSEMVDAGLFCERINKYGGMTRELHGRFTRQGFKFMYLQDCLARQICKSSGWEKKDKEIPEMRDLLKRMFSR